MSNVIRFLLVIGVVFGGNVIFAQELGLLPPKIKWQQLRHDSIRIIYPEGHEQTARRVASLMLKVAVADPITDHCRYKPISVLLQPETNISNGYVGLAPYMSEFYLQPNENPFQLGSLDWADLLALHEYRHVQQLNAANTGFSHLVKVIFGDLAFSGLYNLSVPNWFREGDAVYSETKWSRQGRGRLSYFTLPFREKLKSGKPWNYYMVRNGSYRQFTPDHYPLGYLMVQYGNHVFGEATWDTLIRNAPRFKNILRPFSKLAEEKYGERNKNMYLDAMNWYQNQWELRQVKDIEYPMISLREKDLENVFFDMTFPSIDGDGTIYTTITTFDKTTAIYGIHPDGQQYKVISMGIQLDSYFDYSEDKLVWTELRFDPRWQRRNKNVIVVYDQESGKKKSIKPVKGFYTPSLNKTGDKIVALHVDLDGKYNLQILDANTGDIINTLPNPSNLYLGYPCFSEDELSIIATSRNHEGRMCIVEQTIQTGNITPITHYSYSVLGRPVVAGPWIFIATGMDELDQVFAVDKSEGVFYQVSGGNSAHYDPTWDPVQESIVCSEYTLQGKKLVRVPGLPRQWKMKNLDDGIRSMEGASERNLLTENQNETNFEIKKYSPWNNILNVHSWVVAADGSDYGIEVRSLNIMNTVAITTGYKFYTNGIRDIFDGDPTFSGHFVDMSLGMWYPVVSLGYRNVGWKAVRNDGIKYRRENNLFYAGVSLPLTFNAGTTRQTVYVASEYDYGTSDISPLLDEFKYHFNFLSHRVLLINSRIKAYRQAMPSWAQRLDIRYAYNLSGIPISQLYASTDLSIPNPLRSHYLVLQGEYMYQNIQNGSLQLGSPFIGARGFDNVDGKNQYKLGITYGFPLVYPDRGIGNIFYTRRIRLQPFFDYAYTNDTQFVSSVMKSVGAEIIFDFDFPPVNVGFRYSRLVSESAGNANTFELYLPSQRF